MTIYQTRPVLLQDKATESFAVMKSRPLGGWRQIFVVRGNKALERAEYVKTLMETKRSPNEERLLQRILTESNGADAELRLLVGANPRRNVRKAVWQ